MQTSVLHSRLAKDDPGGWLAVCEEQFAAKFRETLKHPPDGQRPAQPGTRAHAPEDWVAVMITDSGYAMLDKQSVAPPSLGSDERYENEFTDVPASRVALWMMGRDEFGRSTCIWLHHLLPYFYVGISHSDTEWARVQAPFYARSLRSYLEYKAQQEPSWRKRPQVLEVRVVKRRWFYGYRPDPSGDRRAPRWALDPNDDATHWDGSTTQASDWYLKVCAGAPFQVNKLRSWASEWSEKVAQTLDQHEPGQIPRASASDRHKWRVPVIRTTSTVMAPVSLTVFEANVEFSLRCMIDRGLVGCGWCVVHRSMVGKLDSGIRRDTQGRSRCQESYVIDARIFERAERDRDRALNQGQDPQEALRLGLVDASLRFVAREADLQCYVDGKGAYTTHPDPMEAWFEDLRQSTAPLTIMSFDIECCNPWGSFPKPEEEESQVINLAARIYRLDRVEAYERQQQEAADGDPKRCKWPPPLDAVVMGIGQREPMHQGGMDGYGVRSVSFSDEQSFLLAFAAQLRVWDPDIIEGYNSVAFDMAYLLIRAKTLGIEHEFWELGRLVGFRSEPRVEEFGNKAKGKRKEYRAHLHGRVQFDLLRVCVDDIALKLRSYTLNNVSYQLLNEGKKDMDYKLIPSFHARGPDGRRILDEYCDADAVLPFKIERHQSYLMRYIELARVTGVPMRFLLEKGQQVLVFAQLLRKGRELNYVIPWLPVVEPEQTLTESRKNKAYEGAVVIDPSVGFYTIHQTGPVVVNDYNSLYPSSMISQNLGYTTHVTDPVASDLCRQQHKQLRDSHDLDMQEREDQWYDGDLKVRSYETQGGWKVAPVDSDKRLDPVFVRQEVRKSLLAQILEALLAARGVAKKLMKQYPKGSPPYKVQDARQMALKVCANSVYGFTGAPVGRQPDLDVSGATTGYGRKALYFAQRLSEQLLPGDNEVVYGDSVVGNTPIIVRYPAVNTTPHMLHIKDLCPHTDERWEQKPTGKYEVDAYRLGWEVWSDKGWTPIKRLIRHRTNKRIYTVVTERGSVSVTEDHSLLRHDGSMVRPADLRYGDRLLHVQYLPEEPRAQMDKKKSDDVDGDVYMTLPQDGNITHAYKWWYWESRFVGRSVSRGGNLWIDDDPAKSETVCSISYADCDGGWGYKRNLWVYDLETENHHFAAGEGHLVVHNTDSVMVCVKDACTHEASEPGKPLSQAAIEAVAKAFQRGALLDEAINCRVLPPMRIETEKVYAPFLLLGRKKYLTLMWMKPGGPFGIDAKGIEMVRRDNPHIVGLACAAFADLLMGKGPKLEGKSDQVVGIWPDLETAKQFLRDVHARMLEDDLPFEAYVISAKYSKPADEYKTIPPHVALAMRMQHRDEGSAPKLGDRVPYVIVRPEFSEPVRNHEKSVLYKDTRGVKVRDCAEDPQWAYQHKMRIDNQVYAAKKFEPPFLRMLAPILAKDELQSGVPKDPRMWTRQNWRHRDHPEKLEEWIQKKRQANAEAVVHQAVFAENHRSRKIQRTTHPDCAIERAFKRAETSEAAEDEVGDPQQGLLEALDMRGAEDRMMELLNNIRKQSKQKVEDRLAALPPPPPPGQPRPQKGRQTSITQFFGA